jgi:hypothetical protein
MTLELKGHKWLLVCLEISISSANIAETFIESILAKFISFM